MKKNYISFISLIAILTNLYAEEGNASLPEPIHNKNIFYGIDLHKRTFNYEGFTVIEDKSPYLIIYSRSFNGWEMTIRVPDGKIQSIRLTKMLTDTEEEIEHKHNNLIAKNELIYNITSECEDNKVSLRGKGCIIMYKEYLIDTGIIQQEDGRWALVNGATYLGR